MFMRLIDIDSWKNKNDAFFGLGLQLDIDRVVETLNQMPTVGAIPIEYIENWLKELRKSLRNVQMSIPDYNDTMNKLDEFERVIHMMIYNWREENETD